MPLVLLIFFSGWWEKRIFMIPLINVQKLLSQRVKWTLLPIFGAFLVSPWYIFFCTMFTNYSHLGLPNFYSVSPTQSPSGSVLNPLSYTVGWKLPSGKKLGQSKGSRHLSPFSQGSSHAAYFQCSKIVTWNFLFYFCCCWRWEGKKNLLLYHG